MQGDTELLNIVQRYVRGASEAEHNVLPNFHDWRTIARKLNRWKQMIDITHCYRDAALETRKAGLTLVGYLEVKSPIARFHKRARLTALEPEVLAPFWGR